MSLVNSASKSTAERSIGLRRRPDLIINESVFQGEQCWIVKDPLAMKYFRLRKPEFLVLQLLDGSSNYQGIKEKLVAAFPEFKIRLESVQHLVVSLHQYGLLISEASGQSTPLKKRRSQELRQKTIGLASSLIALRLPGWDPETFLSWLYPKCRWMFSSWFTACVITTCLGALMLVLVNFATFQSKLPGFQQFFAFDNVLFLGVLLMATKSIHELGHGLMCKHYGGECHEIGFMLLVLMPAMYCNTSDSWVLPNRWQRMAIGAAGMYVELFVAAICTFVWWFTHPGWIHYTALNVMFLSSVSTVVFNANPLLRYDGYYILSDYLEIPNMAQKSKTSLLSVLRVWLLGMKPIDSRRLPERNLFPFAIYSVASFVYRWMIMIFIFWFLAEVFEPYGLSPIAHLVIAISLIGMVVVPVFKLIKFFYYPGRLREVKKRRLYFSLICLAGLFAFVSYYPFPHYVWGNFVVRPIDAQQLVLSQPGKLIEIVTRESSLVSRGQTIAVLENDELRLEKVELEVRRTRLQQDLDTYQTYSSIHNDASARIAEAASSLASVEQQIGLLDRQLESMTLKANRAGRLFAPLNRKSRDATAGDLAQWSQTPLSQQNLGAWFEANTLFGIVGDSDEMVALIVIDQSDVQLLQPGQSVLAQCHQFAGAFLHTELEAISRDELLQVPPELSQSHGGPIAVKMNRNGEEQPLLKAYSAFAKLDSAEIRRQQLEMVPGMQGQVKILVGSSSIGSRVKRYLSSVIKFR